MLSVPLFQTSERANEECVKFVNSLDHTRPVWCFAQPTWSFGQWQVFSGHPTASLATCPTPHQQPPSLAERESTEHRLKRGELNLGKKCWSILVSRNEMTWRTLIIDSSSGPSAHSPRLTHDLPHARPGFICRICWDAANWRWDQARRWILNPVEAWYCISGQSRLDYCLFFQSLPYVYFFLYSRKPISTTCVLSS